VIPQVNLSVLAPVGFVAIGAMAVLVGEVLLSRAKTFLGREVNASLIGGVLAGIAVVALGLACMVACQAFAAGTTEVFNASRPMFQLDRFSALATALIALASLLSCVLSVYYLDEVHINHGEYYSLMRPG